MTVTGLRFRDCMAKGNAQKKTSDSTATIGFEAKLWLAADKGNWSKRRLPCNRADRNQDSTPKRADFQLVVADEKVVGIFARGNRK